MTRPFNPQHPVPCVYLKHGAYWLVKRGKWTRIGATLDEALAEYARRVHAPKAGKLPALIDSTLTTHCALAKLSGSTKVQYASAADVLKRRFAQFDRPDQVKPRHVAQIKTDGATTPNFTNRVVSVLRTLFGYWLEQQLCDSNPCVGVRRHREAKRKRLLSIEEWQTIRDAAEPRLRALMPLQLLTGQRVGDVLAIRRSQLTGEGVEFRQQKTGKVLVVRWSPDLRAAVADALALHGRAQGLTLLPGPPSYHAMQRAFQAACKAAGIEDARLNDQRAQALTAARRQGRDATALAGHSTAAMTQRYLRDREVPVVEGPALRQVLDVGQKAQR